MVSADDENFSTHCTGKAKGCVGSARRDRQLLQQLQQAGAVVADTSRAAARASTTFQPLSAEIGTMACTVMPRRVGKGAQRAR